MPERAMYPVEASFLKSLEDILPSFDGNGSPQSKGPLAGIKPTREARGLWFVRNYDIPLPLKRLRTCFTCSASAFAAGT